MDRITQKHMNLAFHDLKQKFQDETEGWELRQSDDRQGKKFVITKRGDYVCGFCWRTVKDMYWFIDSLRTFLIYQKTR